MELNTKIQNLNKVGKVVSQRLLRLGIQTVADLIYYFPFRYEDYSQVVKIKDLHDGQIASIKGRVELIKNKRSWKQKKIITEALVSDEDETVRVVWFGQPFISKNINIGDVIYLSGKVKEDLLGPQFISPIYEKERSNLATTHTARLIPIYPLTANLTQKQIRFLVSQVMDAINQIDDWLPEKILEDNDFIPLSSALTGIHFPADQINLQQSLQRLKFDEIFLLQLKAEAAKANRHKIRAKVLPFKQVAIKQFVKSLPFILTKTQKISSWEILQDMEKNIPMNRLLSGDVGSGKTVVSAIAMLNCAFNDFQAVLMAPTEILAVQHYHTLVKLYGHKVTVALITQSRMEINQGEWVSASKKGRQKEFLDKLKKGEIQAVVGTHALLSNLVRFEKLGMVIVDEQHRFGVEQRKVIKEKGRGVHFLSMTATPIPRSLALMLYGELDISIINELPMGRKPVLTRLVEAHNRFKAYDFIRKQVKAGRQVFVVCPLIEEKIATQFLSDKKTVLNEYEKLSHDIFPDLRIGYLHGKLPADEKNETMRKFQQGVIDILVSTSVIEVGVDIANASVMMIEGAERFGLAQLHQFRGRVGRSQWQSYCFLFTDNESKNVIQRLKFFEANNNGFKLAEKDLQLRGPGEVYGQTQSGIIDLKLAKLSDGELIKKARLAAKEVINNLSQYPILEKKIINWQKDIHLE